MTTNRGVHLAMGGGSEFDAIRAMVEEWGPRAAGIGDDAAVLVVPPGQRLVASTDASIEGVHFRRAWLSPEEVGARAAAAALSDLAAMAAAPLGLLLALAVPESWQSVLVDVARGVGAVAGRVGCAILGGNVARASELSLTTTVLGSVVRPTSRAGARPGDALFVTGRLGGPRAALLALLDGRTPDPAHRARLATPVPRVAEARWLADQGTTAAIDISDGLIGDAEHLARASGVTLVLEAASVPRMTGVRPEEALASGEEYELLVTLPFGGADVTAFERLFGIPLTCIGAVEAAGANPVIVVGARVDPTRGHDHLS